MHGNGLEIKDGCLHVTKDLRQDFDLSFDEACNELLESNQKELIINLGSVTYINSTYIGMIAATYFQAQASGKTLKVIARGSVLNILKAAGFEGFIVLEESKAE